jgi:hypothetical protein
MKAKAAKMMAACLTKATAAGNSHHSPLCHARALFVVPTQAKIAASVKHRSADLGSQLFFTWDHLVAMLGGQLAHIDSLRDIAPHLMRTGRIIITCIAMV